MLAHSKPVYSTFVPSSWSTEWTASSCYSGLHPAYLMYLTKMLRVTSGCGLQRAMLERLTALLASVLGAQVPLAVAALEGMCLLLEVLGEVSPEQLASLEEPVVGKLLSGSACLRRQVSRPMCMQALNRVLTQRTPYVLQWVWMGFCTTQKSNSLPGRDQKKLVPCQCQTLVLTSRQEAANQKSFLP